MSWQIIILGHAFVVSLSLLAMRALAREKYGRDLAFVANAGMYVFLYLAGLSFLPFIGKIDISGLAIYTWNFIAGGLFYGFSNIFQFKVLNHLDAGISGVLNSISVLFTVVLAALVLHEDLSIHQAAGGLILLAAVSYILTVARQPGGHRLYAQSWLKGFSYSVIGSLFLAGGIVNEKYLLGKMTLGTYILVGWGVQTLVIISIALLVQRRKFKTLSQPRVLRLVGMAGLTRGVSGYLFLSSQVKSNNVALVTVIASVKLIFLVLLGALLLRERDKLTEKLTAAFLAMAGLAVIFW